MLHLLQNMIKLYCAKGRFSLVVKQMHGKHQRTVQFSHSAPLKKAVRSIRTLDTRLVKSLFLW